MFLKRRTRTKDGKTPAYYSVCESLRVSRDRVVQRQILHLGELNTTQLDSWQHSIDVLHEEGQRRQLRRFTDRDQGAPNDPDVVEVKLSSFAVKSPRRFGDCWAATQLREDLGLRAFWQNALADAPGDVPWDNAARIIWWAPPGASSRLMNKNSWMGTGKRCPNRSKRNSSPRRTKCMCSAAATPAACVCPRPAAGGAGTRGTAGCRLNLCGRPAPFAGHNSPQINPHVVSRAKVRLGRRKRYYAVAAA